MNSSRKPQPQTLLVLTLPVILYSTAHHLSVCFWPMQPTEPHQPQSTWSCFQLSAFSPVHQLKCVCLACLKEHSTGNSWLD